MPASVRRDAEIRRINDGRDGAAFTRRLKRWLLGGGHGRPEGLETKEQRKKVCLEGGGEEEVAEEAEEASSQTFWKVLFHKDFSPRLGSFAAPTAATH